MPYQRSLTIVAPVREGAEGEVESLLATMGDGVANGSVIDFGALDGVHFARLIMAPADTDQSGARLPASVILLSDVDGAVDAHLEQLVETAGDGHRPGLRALRGLSGRRAGPDASASTTCAATSCKEAARYVNTTGRTVRQIRQESALRDAIEAALDDPARNWARSRSRRRPPRGARARCAGSGARLARSSRSSGRRSRRARRTRCTSSPSRS